MDSHKQLFVKILYDSYYKFNQCNMVIMVAFHWTLLITWSCRRQGKNCNSVREAVLVVYPYKVETGLIMYSVPMATSLVQAFAAVHTERYLPATPLPYIISIFVRRPILDSPSCSFLFCLSHILSKSAALLQHL